MDSTWSTVARRAVEGLGVAAGELVLVRDLAGRPEALTEVLLAIEQRGATPLPEIIPVSYQRRLLTSAPMTYLAEWDTHRVRWVQEADRILVLEGADLDTTEVPPEAFAAWAAAGDRLNAIDEERRLPYLLLAVPTTERAAALGLSLTELDAIVLPALTADRAELGHEMARVRAAVGQAQTLTIATGDDCELSLARGDRPWLEDDGVISDEDRAHGTQVVMNLPSGTVYTTVLETETRGRLRLLDAGEEDAVTLHFAQGRVAQVEGGPRADILRAMFDRHTGDARRIGHIGIGLNPHLRQSLDWPLVDIHRHGRLFVSFGENRYLGGENASSLNVDFALPNATLRADDRLIVDRGVVVA